MPGPASTGEERSLRKIFVRGDRGSIPAEDYFSDAIIRNACLTENPTIGRVLPISQPRLEKAVAAEIYYCMKRNVALKIGPMTSSETE